MALRPTRDEVYMEVCYSVAKRSTCRRRQVGCVLVDTRGLVLAVGYNGVATGRPHCIDTACPGAGYPHGQGLDKCEALHAEANALLQCANTQAIHTAYCTAFPCAHCLKLLSNTSCKKIVYVEAYSNAAALDLWDGEIVQMERVVD